MSYSPKHAKMALRSQVMCDHGAQCVYCGAKRPLTVDHYHPKALGGADTVDNMAPSCLRCNASKRDMLPLDFVVNRVLRAKERRRA